ncbi:hypothetical protein [Pseudophaeobacter sp.]|uniref:hypothetical protein n=1 Tax=Pseudophaeobacter sp. TaxID=1971739 RepID=UPI003291F830
MARRELGSYAELSNYWDNYLRTIEEDEGHSSEAAVKARLWVFFRKALYQGWLQTVVVPKATSNKQEDPFLREVENAVRASSDTRNFNRTRLKVFAETKPLNYSLHIYFARRIIDAIRETTAYKTTPQLRELWRDIFGTEPGYRPHLLSRLQRPNREHDSTIDNCELAGDYFLFRADPGGHVTTAFFRFYPHESNYMRSMGLRLDSKHGRLSSKGWVTKQDQGYLVSGYIVDRSKRSVSTLKQDGGFTNLWVDTRSSMPLYQVRKEEYRGKSLNLIALASVFHFQASFQDIPSCSRGVLIRARNLSADGGQSEQNRQERHEMVYDFHSELRKRFSGGLEISDASRLLSHASGLPVATFRELFSGKNQISTYADLVRDDELVDVFEGPISPFSPFADMNKPDPFSPLEEIYLDGSESFDGVLGLVRS